jgi:hypothetical protein
MFTTRTYERHSAIYYYMFITEALQIDIKLTDPVHDRFTTGSQLVRNPSQQ